MKNTTIRKLATYLLLSTLVACSDDSSDSSSQANNDGSDNNPGQTDNDSSADGSITIGTSTTTLRSAMSLDYGVESYSGTQESNIEFGFTDGNYKLDTTTFNGRLDTEYLAENATLDLLLDCYSVGSTFSFSQNYVIDEDDMNSGIGVENYCLAELLSNPNGIVDSDYDTGTFNLAVSGFVSITGGSQSPSFDFQLIMSDGSIVSGNYSGTVAKYLADL